MQGLTRDRRRSSLRRRQTIRRRRAVALVVLVTLVAFAVWAAYSMPSTTPAQVPNAAAAALSSSQGSTERVAVARTQGVDLLLPVQKAATTAIAFHPVDNPNAVALTPYGELISGGGLATRLADVFQSGGDVRYYLMGGNGADRSASTAGLDVGAQPASFVFSPIDGHVTSVKDYRLLGRYTDTEVDIQFADDPSLLLVVTHIEKPAVKIGDEVAAGQTLLGRVRAYPQAVSQSLKQFTSDAGDHVQLVVLRVTASLAGF